MEIWWNERNECNEWNEWNELNKKKKISLFQIIGKYHHAEDKINQKRRNSLSNY